MSGNTAHFFMVTIPVFKNRKNFHLQYNIIML